jgi:hypothetical protein
LSSTDRARVAPTSPWRQSSWSMTSTESLVAWSERLGDRQRERWRASAGARTSRARGATSW